MPKPDLYIMCGISGSGKTTFAKKFAQDNDILYLNPDEFYALYNGDECLHYNEFEIWMALFRALHMAEQSGRSCILDTNAPTVCGRTQLLDWFPDFEHHLIYIKASEGLCRGNNLSRRRVVPDDVMNQLFRTFQAPCFDEDPRWATMTFIENIDNEFKKFDEKII